MSKGVPSSGGNLPPRLKQFLDKSAESLEVLAGNRGDPLDAALTKRDLVDAGILKVISARFGRDVKLGISDGITSPPVPILSRPPKPTSLTANGTFGHVILTWDSPRTRYGNHAYTAIFRNTTDNIGTAVEIAQATSSFNFADNNVVLGPTYYYWIRFVSTSSIAGDFNSSVGTPGAPANTDAPIVLAVDNIVGLDASFIEAHITTLYADVIEGDVNKTYNFESTAVISLASDFTNCLNVVIESQTRPRIPFVFARTKLLFSTTGNKTIKFAFFDWSGTNATVDAALSLGYTLDGSAGAYYGIDDEGAFGVEITEVGTGTYIAGPLSSVYKGLSSGDMVVCRPSGGTYIWVTMVSSVNVSTLIYTDADYPSPGMATKHTWTITPKWRVKLPASILNAPSFTAGNLYKYNAATTKPFINLGETQFQVSVSSTSIPVDVSNYMLRLLAMEDSRQFFVSVAAESGATCEYVSVDTVMLR